MRRLTHTNIQPRPGIIQEKFSNLVDNASQGSLGCLADIDFHSVLYFILKPEHLETYHYIGHKEVCRWCMAAKEMLFIYDMQLEDLPLYVSHPWVFESSRLWYLKRLSRGIDIGGRNAQEIF